MSRDVNCMQRQIELDGTESNIEILSELRAQFNCFDKQEEPVYRALSDAISALKGWWSYPLPAQPEIMYYPQVDGITPSVIAQPERKRGAWVGVGFYDKDCGHHLWYACDKCSYQTTWHMKPIFNFCPNCGADMRGVKNE